VRISEVKWVSYCSTAVWTAAGASLLTAAISSA